MNVCVCECVFNNAHSNEMTQNSYIRTIQQKSPERKQKHKQDDETGDGGQLS